MAIKLHKEDNMGCSGEVYSLCEMKEIHRIIEQELNSALQYMSYDDQDKSVVLKRGQIRYLLELLKANKP